MTKILNKYLNTKTGEIFFIWETKQQYEKRNSLKYKQLSYTLEEYNDFKAK
jgi:transposase